jgi:hypothetical protein
LFARQQLADVDDAKAKANAAMVCTVLTMVVETAKW